MAKPRLHQPWRGWIALAELLVAAGLLVAAYWAWGHGQVRIELPGPGGSPDTVTKMLGNWLASAVAAVTVAAVLVLHAVQQAVLAVRIR